jgi:hypothetical protein
MAAEDTIATEETMNADEKNETDEVMDSEEQMTVQETTDPEAGMSPEEEMTSARAMSFGEVVKQEAATTVTLNLDGTGGEMYQVARMPYLMLSLMDQIL